MYVSSIELTLHSKDAEMLFNGGVKTREFIPGFYYTQKRLNALFAMAMKENPYAEAALIEVDLRLEEVEVMVSHILERSGLALEAASREGIVVQILESNTPSKFRIDYASEYTNQLAKMMTRVDWAFRNLRSAHSAGYIDTHEATELIRAMRRKVRMIFDRIITYAKKIHPSVTRQDLKEKTVHAQSMIEKFGMPNEAILDKTITFKVKRISELAV